MNNYEILYIIENSVEDTAREAVVAKWKTLIESNGGAVEKVDKWGLRKFAYPIDYKNDGYYVLMNFSCAPTLIKEIERQMRISDEVIRYMTIRKDK